MAGPSEESSRFGLLAPRFWPGHLLALACVAAATGLGLWQYDAYAALRDAQAVDPTTLAPTPLAEQLGPDDPFPGRAVGRPVVLEGTWVPGSTVFVEGRVERGEDGFWVATPLEVAGTGSLLYVVRGWVADPATAPAAPTGEAELVGFLQPAEGAVVRDEVPGDDVVPQLRTGDLVQQVDADLYGGYAVVADEVAGTGWPVGAAATNPGTEGLVPASLEQLPQVGGSSGLRNLLYGIEWWLFGAFAAFIWWRWVRDLRGDDEDEDDEGGDDDGGEVEGASATVVA